MKPTQSRWLAVTVTVALAAWALGACGGDGGSDGDAAAPPAPAPAPPAPVPDRQASAASPMAAACTGGVVGGTAYLNAEVEPWIAADPTNANRLLAAWQQDRWSNGGARGLVTALSSDGGATWQRTLQPFSRCGGAAPGSAGNFERTSDPWVDFGPDGHAYAMGLVTSGAALTAGSDNGMAASRSTDGGRTWSAPVLLIRDGDSAFNDKNTLTADPTAPGFVYAVWDRLQRSGNGPTVLARSTDAGASWEAARTIFTPAPAGGAAGTSQTIGNRIVVLTAGAERGALVNVFTQIDTVAGIASARVGVTRSLDRGLTWSAPVYIAEQRAVGTRDAASGARVRDGSILPAIAAGPRGELWVAWQDARFTPGAIHDAIVIAGSTDGGRTWSAPRAINLVPTAPAFTPAVHVRADGTVGVLHFDLRNNTADAATLLANAWLLTSRDGVAWAEAAVGSTFDLTFAPDANGLFVGDYHGLVSLGTAFVPLLATTNADAANRTDVRAPRIDVAAAAAAAAPALTRARTALAKLDAMQAARSRAAHHEAIVDAMERRVPGWSRWVGVPAP